MTKPEIQSEIQQVVNLTDVLLERYPNNEKELVEVKRFLANISDMASKNWPLTDEERKTINIGIYAVRLFDGGPAGYEEFVCSLTELDAHLKLEYK